MLRKNNHSKAPTTVELPPLGRNALQCSHHKRTHDWLKSDRNSGRTPEGSRYRTLLCIEGVGRFLLLLLPQCFLDGGLCTCGCSVCGLLVRFSCSGLICSNSGQRRRRMPPPVPPLLLLLMSMHCS